MAGEVPSGNLREPLLTERDVAAFLQCSVRKVQRMIKEGELEAIRFGRLVRVRPEALTAFIERK
jgi:excisionase family DNA binding protein